MENYKRPYVLAILDGYGFSKKTVGNPMKQASMPTMSLVSQSYPMALLQASGLGVGMTWGESGNSEVGHLNIGAGKIVEQYLSRIKTSVKNNSFFEIPALARAFEHATQNNSKVHIIGLLTSGTVHADFSIPIDLIEMAMKRKFEHTYLHLFLDGKDSGLRESPELLGKLQESMLKHGFGKIASLIGRKWAMDRDNHWDFTQKAYDLFTKGMGEATESIIDTISKYHEQGESDSSMPPIVTQDFSAISDNDAIIFFNFREDSMRQIARAFVEPEFSKFPIQDLKNIFVTTMTPYLENSRAEIAFAAPKIKNCLAEVISQNGKTQLHIAETEKYAHVTYFFNGLRNQKFEGETDFFIESLKDNENNPSMKALELGKRISEAINENIYDFIVVNIANPDVLAHTGNYDATVKGLEAADITMGLIKNAVLEKDGVLFITADHGNAETLVYSSGDAETKHDDSPVPFHIVAKEFETMKTAETMAVESSGAIGMLADVAPTILNIMGIAKPEEMTGKDLLETLKSSLT